MKQIEINKLQQVPTSQLLSLVKRALNRRDFASFFQIIETTCSNEITTFNTEANRFVENIVETESALNQIASLYQNIASVTRQAIENNILALTSRQSNILDVISLTYICSLTGSCAAYNWTDPRRFVFRNSKNHAFWQWYRAHLPHATKFLSFENYEYPVDFVLPSIIMSDPNNLQYYKVLCRELKKGIPEAYEHYRIESPICKAMIKRLKQKALGQEPPRQSFPAHLAKNNLLILDILR